MDGRADAVYQKQSFHFCRHYHCHCPAIRTIRILQSTTTGPKKAVCRNYHQDKHIFRLVVASPRHQHVYWRQVSWLVYKYVCPQLGSWMRMRISWQQFMICRGLAGSQLTLLISHNWCKEGTRTWNKKCNMIIILRSYYHITIIWSYYNHMIIVWCKQETDEEEWVRLSSDNALLFVLRRAT